MSNFLKHWINLLFGRFSCLGPPFVGANHSMQGTPHKTLSCRKALTQMSSHLNLVLGKVAEILLFGNCSCQNINFKNSLFMCFLIYPTAWQVPLLLNNNCYSLHLTEVLMLWLNSVSLTTVTCYFSQNKDATMI